MNPYHEQLAALREELRLTQKALKSAQEATQEARNRAEKYRSSAYQAKRRVAALEGHLERKNLLIQNLATQVRKLRGEETA